LIRALLKKPLKIFPYQRLRNNLRYSEIAVLLLRGREK
jgi:hypothetical protein